MWRANRCRLSVTAATIALLWALSATATAQDELPDGQTNEIEYHERMLQERTAEVERVRAVAQKTAGEIADVEDRLASEPDGTLRRYLENRLENLRVLFLRRTILLRRSELKQQELGQHLDRLKQDSESGVPRPPEQKLDTRRDGLTRRLSIAESLLELITQYEQSAVTEHEKRRISRLAEAEREVIAGITAALADLEDDGPDPSQQ